MVGQSTCGRRRSWRDDEVRRRPQMCGSETRAGREMRGNDGHGELGNVYGMGRRDGES